MPSLHRLIPDKMPSAASAPYLADQFHLDKTMIGNIFSMGGAGSLRSTALLFRGLPESAP